MQELQRKQQEQKRMREAMKTIEVDPTPEERVDRMRLTQSLGVEQIFAQQYSTIFNAAAEGTLPAVKHFLDARARVKNTVKDQDIAGKCAIHYAAEKGHNHIIQFLLDRSCPVDIRSQDGTTPLMYACKMNRVETIALLIECGANLLLKNNASMSAMHFACSNDNREAMEVCFTLYKDLKESFISKGVKSSDKAAAKSTASKKASAPVEEKKSLLGAIVSLGRSGKEGAAPVAAATGGSHGHKHNSIAHSNGGDGDDDDGSVTSAGSKKIGKKEQMKTDMLAAPDNVILEAETLNELRPLHIAVQYDAQRCVDYLLDQGVDITATDFDGDTALHKAAKFHYYQIYRQLVAAGADPNQRNNLKETPQRLLNWDNTYLG